MSMKYRALQNFDLCLIIIFCLSITYVLRAKNEGIKSQPNKYFAATALYCNSTYKSLIGCCKHLHATNYFIHGHVHNCRQTFEACLN
jgi:hypothetical protein